jgi:hypothetical protein
MACGASDSSTRRATSRAEAPLRKGSFSPDNLSGELLSATSALEILPPCSCSVLSWQFSPSGLFASAPVLPNRSDLSKLHIAVFEEISRAAETSRSTAIRSNWRLAGPFRLQVAAPSRWPGCSCGRLAVTASRGRRLRYCRPRCAVVATRSVTDRRGPRYAFAPGIKSPVTPHDICPRLRRHTRPRVLSAPCRWGSLGCEGTTTSRFHWRTRWLRHARPPRT